MFLGDKGRPSQYKVVRYNYDIIIDNEKNTVRKIARALGFYTILFSHKMKEVEVVYDTDRFLLTGAGLILKKKINPDRAYFSLVRIISSKNIKNREKRSFLGECDKTDNPSDFPTQIADGINRVFNNLFTINVAELVKHCTTYLRTDVTGNRYKIISGTGYEATMSFENLKVRDMRTGRKGKKRIFVLKMEADPAYEKEIEQILKAVDRYCKELVPIDRNRFEIGKVLVTPPQPKEETANPEDEKFMRKKKKKKNEEA